MKSKTQACKVSYTYKNRNKTILKCWLRSDRDFAYNKAYAAVFLRTLVNCESLR
jgi:hypothetical protein